MLVAVVVLTACLALVVSSVSGGGDSGRARSETDGAFIAGMVPHHSAAAELAQIAVDRSERREVKRLAQGIVDSQIQDMGVLRDIHQRLFGAPLSTMSAGDRGAARGLTGDARQSGRP